MNIEHVRLTEIDRQLSVSDEPFVHFFKICQLRCLVCLEIEERNRDFHEEELSQVV